MLSTCPEGVEELYANPPFFWIQEE